MAAGVHSQDSLYKAYPETGEAPMGPTTNMATCSGVLNIP